MDELTQDERVAFSRLRALLELLPSELDRQMAPTGLTSFEFTLLEALHAAELNRLRLSALASQTNATLPRLSRVVSGLERKGLVSRMPCDEDGRAINAVLTEAGDRAFSDGSSRYTGAIRHTVLDGLDPEGVSTLAAMTLSILTTLDPERRMAVTSSGDVACAADPVVSGGAGSSV
jgi:DNA-binding MarR family transcriptional regulator